MLQNVILLVGILLFGGSIALGLILSFCFFLFHVNNVSSYKKKRDWNIWNNGWIFKTKPPMGSWPALRLRDPLVVPVSRPPANRWACPGWDGWWMVDGQVPRFQSHFGVTLPFSKHDSSSRKTHCEASKNIHTAGGGKNIWPQKMDDLKT